MRRTIRTFTVESTQQITNKMLSWASKFDTHLWLDSNQYLPRLGSYDALLAVGIHSKIDMQSQGAFDALDKYQSQTNDWLFGYLGYDLKNDTEKLSSQNIDGLDFSDVFFFQPKKLWILKGNHLEAHYLSANEIDSDWTSIVNTNPTNPSKTHNDFELIPRIPKNEYIERVSQLLAHIHRGDIYEVNFCMEWFIEQVQINPTETFVALNQISKPPFASYFKNHDQYILSASPERYLKKEGKQMFSQPIKGTARRSEIDAEDDRLASQLKNDKKERSENIMIVDLVRNDLSKTAVPGSVHVTELCETYSFEQVHQMISTVVSTLKDNCSAIDVIKTTFPMGSMTGAPKLKAMELIEKYERTKRGVYSGAIGYFSPEGNFDFNVVIRSIVYNASKRYVSFQVGSAITANASPDNEYEECLLKAKALRAVLSESLTI